MPRRAVASPEAQLDKTEPRFLERSVFTRGQSGGSLLEARRDELADQDEAIQVVDSSAE